MLKVYRRLSLLLFLLLPSVVQAQDRNEFEIVQDLERSLLIYNSSQESYVPHAVNTPFNENAASFIVNLREKRGLTLLLCLQPQSALFIEQKIVASNSAQNCAFLDIDSLRNIYKKESLFMSLYNKDLSLDETTIQVVNLTSSGEVNQQQETQTLQILPRTDNPFKDFYIIGLLLLLSAFATLKVAYPKIFDEFYSIGKTLTFKWREDSIIGSRAINTTNLLFIFVYSLAMAFVVLSLWFETGGAPQGLAFITFEGFSSSFVSWIVLTLLLFVLVILKYILIWLTSSLLGFKELVSFHFLDFIRISQLLLLFLLCVTTISIMSFRDFITPHGIIFPYILLLCVILTLVLLFIKLLSTSSHRNVHLFSYLCTTEILPLIIGIKFFLNL